MADVYTRIGYIKGATGAQGERGLQGDPGDAATIQVGTVTTVPYGQTANVVNSGTESAAVFDFTIPQGRPGQETTDMQNLVLGSITTSAASFPIPAVGETGKVIFGKITKWFSDMSALVATKFNASNVVNNLTTTDSGYALDARQGKALNDLLTFHNVPQSSYFASINSDLTISSFNCVASGVCVSVYFVVTPSLTDLRGVTIGNIASAYQVRGATTVGMVVRDIDTQTHTSYSAVITAPANFRFPAIVLNSSYTSGHRLEVFGFYMI